MDVERFIYPSAFRTIAESLECLETEIAKLCHTSNDAVLVFKTKVEENLMENEAGKVKFSTKNIESRSIFVSFQSTVDRKCIIHWKTKELKEFLNVKLFDGHQLEHFTDMVQNFLIGQLKRGHTGVLPLYEGLDGQDIVLRIIADAGGFNLLMKASEEGNVEIVKHLLKRQVDISAKANDKYAVDVAWERKHFDVVLELLKSNSKFPSDESFRQFQDLPVDIANFLQLCTNMHKAIDDKDEKKIRNIAEANAHLRHFFSVRNRSALYETVRKGHTDIYELLFSLNIFLAPNERAIYNTMPRDRVQHINNKFSRNSPDTHLLTLLSNSRLFIDNIDVHSRYDSIREAYEILNSIPQIKSILQIVAASENFHIFFDFNRDLVKQMDPVTVNSANGMFYPEGKLYLAFKDYLHSATKFNAIGVLAHELCHFAMHLVFRNERKPYAIGDEGVESEFEIISQLCRDRMDDEKIIKLVYEGKNYDNSKYHTELIVRVPHILPHYHKNLEEIAKCQTTFHELFEFFTTNSLQAIEKTIPVVKMISNDNISFDLLTSALQAKVLQSMVICGKKRITLNEARRFDEYILQKLNSSQICDILNGKVIAVKIDIYVERKFIDRNIDEPYKKAWINTKFDYIHLDKIQSFDDLMTESDTGTRIIVLSDMPGAGKTTSFKQFVMKIKEKYPKFWVFYIDLKHHIDIYEECQTNDDKLEDIIPKMLNFTSDDEKSRYLTDFKDAKNSFFLWDGFDEISESPDYKKFSLNFIRKVKLLGHQQWIATRPQYASELEVTFSTTAYKLVPFTEENRNESLEMFFELKGLSSTEVSEKIGSIRMFLEKLDTNTDYRKFNNPLLLYIAAENSLHEDLHDCNVYTMYENFIFEKVKKLRDKGDLIEGIRDRAIVDGVNVMKVHQKCAIDTVFYFQNIEYLGKTIKISQLKVLGQDDKMSKLKTSVYGISFVKHNRLDFIHRTFAEFFVAQFLIKRIFDVKNDVDEWLDEDDDEYVDEFEATKILILLFRIMSDEMIFKFAFDFVTQNSKTIYVKNSIRQTFRRLTSYEQNIFKYDFHIFRFMMRNFTKLFSFDHDILRHFWALHLNENLFILTLKDRFQFLIYAFNEMFEFVNVKFKNVRKKIVYKYCCDQMDSSSFGHIFSDCDRVIDVEPSNQKEIDMDRLIRRLNLSWIESENKIQIYCKFEIKILKEIFSILKQIPGVTEELLAGKHQRGCNLFEFWFQFHGFYSTLYVDNFRQFPDVRQMLFNFVRTECDADMFTECLNREKFTEFLKLIPNELEVGEIFLKNFKKILDCTIRQPNRTDVEQIWRKCKKVFNDENFLLQVISHWQHRYCSKIYFRDNYGFEYLYDDFKLIAFELSRRNVEYDWLKEFQSQFDEITTNKENFLKILLLDDYDTSFDRNHDFLLQVTNFKWDIYLTLLKKFEKFIRRSRQMKKYFYEKTLEFSCQYRIENVFFHIYDESQQSQDEKLFVNRELIEIFTIHNLEQFIKYSSLNSCTKVRYIMAEIYCNDKDKLKALLMGKDGPNVSIISITKNDPEKLKLFRELLVYAVGKNSGEETFLLKPIADQQRSAICYHLSADEIFFEQCSEIFDVLVHLEEFGIDHAILFSFIEVANLYFNGKHLRTMTLFAFTSKFGENFYDFANNSNIPFNDIVKSHFNETAMSHDGDEVETLKKLKICSDNIRETFFDVCIANFVVKLIKSMEDDVSESNTDWSSIQNQVQKILSRFGNNTTYSNENEIKFLIFISNSDNCANIRKFLLHVIDGASFQVFNKKKILRQCLTKFPHNFPSTFFFVKLLGHRNFAIVNRAWKIDTFQNLSAWFAGNYPDIFSENSAKMIECEKLLLNVYDYEFSGGKLYRNYFKPIGERKKIDFKKMFKHNRRRL